MRICFFKYCNKIKIILSKFMRKKKESESCWDCFGSFQRFQHENSLVTFFPFDLLVQMVEVRDAFCFVETKMSQNLPPHSISLLFPFFFSFCAPIKFLIKNFHSPKHSSNNDDYCIN